MPVSLQYQWIKCTTCKRAVTITRLTPFDASCLFGYINGRVSTIGRERSFETYLPIKTGRDHQIRRNTEDNPALDWSVWGCITRRRRWRQEKARRTRTTSQLFTSGLLGLSRLTQRSPIQHHLLYHLYRRIGRLQLFQPLWISRNYLPSTQRPHYHYFPLSPQRVIPSRNLCRHHLPPLPSTHHPPPTDHLLH